MFYLIFFQDHAKTTVGGIVPQSVFDYFERKKWGAAIFTFFLGNMITGWLSSTGAFEIFLDGQLISSKIHHNMLPRFHDLIRIIEAKGIKLI